MKVNSRPQTILNQVEIVHQLCESQYPEKVNDLYVQSIYSVLVVKTIVVWDTPDLKSCEHCARPGSIPGVATKKS